MFNKNKNKITDYYIYDDLSVLENSYLYQDSVIMKAKDCPSALTDYMEDLKKLCKEKEKNNNLKQGKELVDFSINIENDFFRVHIIHSVNGKIYQLRRIPSEVKTLEELKFNTAIKKLLLHENLKQGGLILITGETGQGKTTTCSATIKERLALFNGFCLTIEDPPEYRLDGFVEKLGDKNAIELGGVCIQTEVVSGKFSDAIKGAMRSYPVINNSILYVGETRDQETAQEVLKIMTNGHLVITTMHADSVWTAIKRFVSLAMGNNDEGNSDYVLDVLGASLRLILHQKLKIKRSGIKGDYSKADRELEIEFLYSPLSNGVAANAIKQMNESSIKTVIDRQKRLLEQKGVEYLMNEYNKIVQKNYQ